MRIYLAGPMSNGGRLSESDELANVRDGMQAARLLLEAGHAVYLPHLWHFFATTVEHGVTREQWIAQDLAWIEACDVVVRLPGESAGADREVVFARQRGIPVWSLEEVLVDHIGAEIAATEHMRDLFMPAARRWGKATGPS